MGRKSKVGEMWEFGGLSGSQVAHSLWGQFWKDRVLDQAAMLSFYLILAIFPLLLSLISFLGVLLRSGHPVQNSIQEYLSRVAPASASGLMESVLDQISKGSSSSTLSLGLLFSFWVASSGMVAIMDSLNVAYEVDESRPWWKQRLVALGLTLGTLLFMGGALLILGYGRKIGTVVAQHLHLGTDFYSTVLTLLEWMLLLGFLLMAFNLLYIFAPNVKRRQWHWLMPGTVLGATLWLAFSYAFKVYLSFFNQYNATYGSITAVIILLLWLYFSGIAIIMGAELNSVIEKRSGRVQPAHR